MQKNEARTALSAMLQRNSEILTKILETTAPKPESGENNAFSLGKQCFYRGKTSDLSRENLHAAEGKHTRCPAETDVFLPKDGAGGPFSLPVGTDGEKRVSAQSVFSCHFVPVSARKHDMLKNKSSDIRGEHRSLCSLDYQDSNLDRIRTWTNRTKTCCATITP